MRRRELASGAIVVVKVGSSSVAGGEGGAGSDIDDAAVDRIIAEVAGSWERGNPTVLVTSGAVSAGMAALGLGHRPSDVPGLQVAASVGQGRLMERYSAGFGRWGLAAGQVLLTKSVLADRDQYLHAREAMERMLDMGIVPVVNENDVVAVDELRLGDNDRLAALVSHLVGAALLVLLTDTAGLLSSDPRRDANAELVSAVRHNDELLDRLARGGAGPLGSGGIATKIAAARMAAWSGIPTVIASSREPDILVRAAAGADVGTWIEPREERLTSRKLWIAFGQSAAGRVKVDVGAVRALVHGGASLLPAGVIAVEGTFGAGSAIDILAPDGELIAKGITRMAAGEVDAMKGRPSQEAGGEVVHRDDLVVFSRP